MPKLGPSGGDNLEKEKPEREDEYVANMLLFGDFVLRRRD